MKLSLVVILTTLTGLAGRVLAASDIDRDDIEKVAVTILAAGGDEADVADAVAHLLEDAVHWPELVSGPAGVLIEEMEDPLIRLAAGRIAKALCRAWKRLGEEGRLALITQHIDARAA